MKTFNEIKEILNSHKEELQRKYKVKEMKIFGSYVRNAQRERSDVDILVDFYEVPDLLKFIEMERYLEEILGVKVDLVRISVLRPELRNEILNEAVKI